MEKYFFQVGARPVSVHVTDKEDRVFVSLLPPEPVSIHVRRNEPDPQRALRRAAAFVGTRLELSQEDTRQLLRCLQLVGNYLRK